VPDVAAASVLGTDLVGNFFSKAHLKYHNFFPAMVKTYNKYEASQSFGLVNSALSNVVSVSDSVSRTSGPGVAVVGACEEVYRWDLKKGELLSKWRDSSSGAQVTAIEQSAIDEDLYAVGYDSQFFCGWKKNPFFEHC
jgi:hypothetical protein